MDRTLTSTQVAGILQRAANFRPDVRKAMIKVDPSYNQNILLVDVSFYTAGTRREMETAYTKTLDGRTCGQILDEWLGPMPKQSQAQADKERRINQALYDERKRYLDNSPAVVMQLIIERKKNPAPKKTPSKFKWDSPRPTPENPSGIIKTPIPEQPVEATKQPEEPIEQIDDKTVRYHGRLFRHIDAGDRSKEPYCPTQNDLFVGQKLFTRCYTREEMMHLGWDTNARRNQYRRQRGKHPSDVDPTT